MASRQIFIISYDQLLGNMLRQFSIKVSGIGFYLDI